MEFLFGFVIGIFIAIVFYSKFNRKKPSGTFIIDLSDPMKDVCRLEMNDNLNAIYNKKQIILDVRTYGNNSPN